ncbi:MAG: hypothetical protein K2X87_09305 [Gemmataceae bacterium]|nr:hypothetical protein [Gemmataceae bacterium]
MKLRVKSDGTANGVWVEDEIGNRIGQIRDISLQTNFEGVVEVTMTFLVLPESKRKIDVTTHDQLARGERQLVDAE